MDHSRSSLVLVNQSRPSFGILKPGRGVRLLVEQAIQTARYRHGFPQNVLLSLLSALRCLWVYAKMSESKMQVDEQWTTVDDVLVTGSLELFDFGSERLSLINNASPDTRPRPFYLLTPRDSDTAYVAAHKTLKRSSSHAWDGTDRRESH